MYERLFPLFYLARDPAYGAAYLRSRRAARRNERLSAGRLRAAQWDKLTSVLRHAYAHVPFYRRRFDEAGIDPDRIRSPEEYRRVPVLTREDLRDNLEDLVATTCDRARLVRGRTGGSTGAPTAFYEDVEARAWGHAVTARARAWAGFSEGQKVAILWGAERDFPSLTMLGRLRVHWIRRERWLNSYAITAEDMERFARLLIRWKPRLVHAYVTPLHLFACFLRERGLDRIRPRAIVTSAEKLWKRQRETIEDVFKCRVFDFYGSRETPAMACECEAHRGLHVLTDNVYLELLDGGRAVETGETGEVIVTGLANLAMPLIRYCNGDLARSSAEACPCGRPFPLISEVIGRSNDLIATPGGAYVHSAFFGHIVSAIEGVQRFQVVQKSLGEVTLSIQATAAVSERDEEELRRKVAAHLGGDVSVTVRRVEEIPLTSTGKHRYIVSEIGQRFGGR